MGKEEKNNRFLRKGKKVRADILLVERAIVPTREKARALIMAGWVKAEGKRVEKPGDMLSPSCTLEIIQPMPFVSRGGLKLAPALEAFGVEVKNKIAADIGSSTGGFTDCLLQQGAKKVYAVDVSVDQLDIKIRSDPRVFPQEKNARFLTPQDFPEPPQVITMDISFISVLKVLPALRSILPEGELIALLKPQFEAEKGKASKKGVIRDPSLHAEVLLRVLEKAQALGFRAHKLFPSPIKGQKGNREFFVLC